MSKKLGVETSQEARSETSQSRRLEQHRVEVKGFTERHSLVEAAETFLAFEQIPQRS
jgi:hypothetical protein